MDLRRLLACAAAALAFGCHSREVSVPTAAPAGDIILVTIDTWRADAAGFSGNGRVQTPFLDSLARRGIIFTNAHAHNVVTLPSHANILTGLNPYQHGVRENAGYVLEAKVQTLAERLKASGYATGAFIGAFPLDAQFGLNQGFDIYDDNYGKGRATLDFTVQERSAASVLEPAARWWRSTEGKRRFLFVHLYEPHAPYTPPEPFLSAYRDNPYLGEVAAVDAALAEHLGPLIAANTTLIITSDHGEALGDHGELTHGLFAYEATLKVPLLVIGPGITRRTEAAFARHIDIAPTIVERAGLATSDLPGQSLLRPIKRADTYFESLSASLNRGWAPLTGLIRDGWKYIDLPRPELYELRSDPNESRNMVGERRRETAAARSALAALNIAPATTRAVSAEEASRLRSLGYVTGSADGRTGGPDPKDLVHIDSKMHRVIDSFERGDREAAVRLAREVVAEQPRMAAGRELLAFVLQESERVTEAVQVLRTLVQSGQGTAASKTQLALLLTESGNPSEALQLLEPLADSDGSADVRNAYGIALADVGRVREAVDQFRRVIALDPNNAPAFQNLGIVALRADDLQAAEQNLGRALELNPRLPLALNTLGVVHARRGDYARAIDAWKRAVAIDRHQYDALFNIGLVSAQRGDGVEARRALAEFIRTAPPSRYRNEIVTARRAIQSLR